MPGTVIPFMARSVHFFCYPIQIRIVIAFSILSETSSEMLTGCRPLSFVLCLLAALSISPASAEHKTRGPNGEPSVSEEGAQLRKEFVGKFNSASSPSLKEKYSRLIRKLDCAERGRDIYDEVLAETKSKKEAREAEFMAVLQCDR